MGAGNERRLSVKFARALVSNFVSSLALALSLSACATGGGIEPAQRAAAPVEDRAPVTILISIDGFHPDYLTRGATPVLSRLLAQQQLHLAEFAAGALPRVRNALHDRARQPAFQRAEQLERLATAVGGHNEILTTDEWHTSLTAKVRALREIGELDAHMLLERAGNGHELTH